MCAAGTTKKLDPHYVKIPMPQESKSIPFSIAATVTVPHCHTNAGWPDFSQWLDAILLYRTQMFHREIPDFFGGEGGRLRDFKNTSYQTNLW